MEHRGQDVQRGSGETEARPEAGRWVLDMSYCAGSVKIVLAAGKVTSPMPWTSPAA